MARGLNFGFSPTSNAGGSMGEAGGHFARVSDAMGTYADATIGPGVTLADTLRAQGKLYVENLGFDGGMAIGWFDVRDAPQLRDFVGILLAEPNSSSGGSFRASAVVQLADGQGILAGPILVAPNTSLNFSITFQPNGGQGFGALSIAVGGAVATANLTAAQRSIGAEMSAFGLASFLAGTQNVPQSQARLFIDDVVYSSPLGTPQVVTNDIYQTPAGTELNVPPPGVQGNDADADGDALEAVGVSGAMHGSLNVTLSGGITYMPEPGFNGIDSFTYQVSDGATMSATATASILVGNAPPLVMDDGYVIRQNESLNLSATGVLANDVSPGGAPLIATLVN